MEICVSMVNAHMIIVSGTNTHILTSEKALHAQHSNRDPMLGMCGGNK